MQRQLFHFDLPTELIAQYPPKNRTDARLLVVDADNDRCDDRTINDVVDLLSDRDLIVFNNTRVIPARLYGRKTSGGKVEVLVERVSGSRAIVAHVRASKSPKPGTDIEIEGGYRFRVTGRESDLFHLELLEDREVADIIEAVGHMPLPPYIERADEEVDRSRYQTVYGAVRGAIAAPTAGLHFDSELMSRMEATGASIAFVTLHVGAGTFQPVREDNIEAHHMHKEFFHVPAGLAQSIADTRSRGGRVIAIGTTTVRALESAWNNGVLEEGAGETDIFIYPGYDFQVVDAMVTNFHLPESTLLMLVSAFAGRETVLQAYRHAVSQRYRFFSYGDAMWLGRSRGAV